MRKLLLGAFVFSLVFACKTGSGEAPGEARKWAKKHYEGQFKMVECGSSDSDDDGYVSCTIFFKEPVAEADGKPQFARDPLAIECAHGHGNWKTCNKQEGCRMATGKSGKRK